MSMGDEADRLGRIADEAGLDWFNGHLGAPTIASDWNEPSFWQNREMSTAGAQAVDAAVLARQRDAIARLRELVDAASAAHAAFGLGYRPAASPEWQARFQAEAALDAAFAALTAAPDDAGAGGAG